MGMDRVRPGTEPDRGSGVSRDLEAEVEDAGAGPSSLALQFKLTVTRWHDKDSSLRRHRANRARQMAKDIWKRRAASHPRNRAGCRSQFLQLLGL